MMIKSFPVLYFPCPLRIRKNNRSSPTDEFYKTGALEKFVNEFK